MAKHMCCVPRLSPNQLRFKCDIQEDTSADGASAVDAVWTTIVPGVNCERKDTGGGERIRGRQIEPTVKSVIRMNTSSVVSTTKTKSDMRLVFSDRTFNISDVRNDSGHPSGPITLDCKAGGDI